MEQNAPSYPNSQVIGKLETAQGNNIKQGDPIRDCKPSPFETLKVRFSSFQGQGKI